MVWRSGGLVVCYVMLCHVMLCFTMTVMLCLSRGQLLFDRDDASYVTSRHVVLRYRYVTLCSFVFSAEDAFIEAQNLVAQE